MRLADTAEPTADTKASPPNVPPPKVLRPTRPRLGHPDPAVLIVEFGGFRCPYSAKATSVIKSVLAATRRQRQAVALEWRNFPLDRHPGSLDTAALAAAADAQGRFWHMHDALFANRGPIDVPKLAQKTGTVVSALEKARQSEDIAEQIARDQRIARAAGAKGTPAFFVNGLLVEGAVTVDALAKVVAAEIQATNALTKRGASNRSALRARWAKHAPELAAWLFDGAPVPEVGTAPRMDSTVHRVLIEDDDPVLGPADAPVTIVEFMDFTCPFCAKQREVARALRSRYPNDIRWVMKYSPNPRRPHALPLAKMAIAAQAADAFERFHEMAFLRGDRIDPQKPERIAKALNIDASSFLAAMNSPATMIRIRRDQTVAARMGAQGTPVLFVNGRRLLGLQDADTLDTVVRAELQRQAGRADNARSYATLVESGHTANPAVGDMNALRGNRAPLLGSASAPIHWVWFVDPASPGPFTELLAQPIPDTVAVTVHWTSPSYSPKSGALAAQLICAESAGAARPYAKARLVDELEHAAALQAAKLSPQAIETCLTSGAPSTVLSRSKAIQSQRTPNVSDGFEAGASVLNGVLLPPNTRLTGQDAATLGQRFGLPSARETL